jgi:putative protease
MELKAPAGTLTSALAAFEAGADSVYVGLASSEHQRKQLKNLLPQEIRELVAAGRPKGQKVIVTFNSTILDDQWSDIDKSAALLSELGVHGVIVADLGVTDHLARHFPDLKLLFSVQGECSNASFGQWLAELGVHRIVLERNMSIKEAKKIQQATGLEVELFVFGYSCYSQDSICYMGDYWSGSPCNVHCSQKVSFDVPGLETPRRYLFMQYYSALRYVPALVENGIDGLKIEGRQRSSHYVTLVTSTFRQAIDHYHRCKEVGRPFHVERHWLDALREAAMAFEVTDGFYQVNDYRRSVLTNPSLETYARYGADTLRNLREGQTSGEFIRRSFVGHLRRAVSKPELDPRKVGVVSKGF